MKKGSIFILLLLLLVTFSLPVMGTSSTVDETTKIGINDAVKATQAYISSIGLGYAPEWQNATIGEPTLYNDKQNMPSVYVVPVLKNNIVVGYVTVSATTEIYPIVAASKGDLPHSKLNEVTEKAKQKINRNQILGSPNLIFGGLSYFAELPIIKDGVQDNSLYYDLRAKMFVEKKDLPMGLKFDEGEKVKEAKDSWTKIKNKSLDALTQKSAIPEFSVLSSRSVSGVPIYDQNDSDNPSNGCGPCSGAMVLSYWDRNGYTNLQSDSDRLYGIALQNCLYVDMNTAMWGTSCNGWATGVRTHTNTQSGYNFSTGFIDKSGGYSGVWSTLTYEIDSVRPLGLYIGLRTGSDGLLYNYHFVTAWGYSDNGSGNRWVNINNCWGSTDAINFDTYWAAKNDMGSCWARPAL